MVLLFRKHMYDSQKRVIKYHTTNNEYFTIFSGDFKLPIQLKSVHTGSIKTFEFKNNPPTKVSLIYYNKELDVELLIT